MAHLTDRGMEAAGGCPASVAWCELGTQAVCVCAGGQGCRPGGKELTVKHKTSKSTPA